MIGWSGFENGPMISNGFGKIFSKGKMNLIGLKPK
jgi:hypothetical protein